MNRTSPAISNSSRFFFPCVQYLHGAYEYFAFSFTRAVCVLPLGDMLASVPISEGCRDSGIFPSDNPLAISRVWIRDTAPDNSVFPLSSHSRSSCRHSLLPRHSLRGMPQYRPRAMQSSETGLVVIAMFSLQGLLRLRAFQPDPNPHPHPEFLYSGLSISSQGYQTRYDGSIKILEAHC